MARKIEELPVYSKAIEFSEAVNAILMRPGLRRKRRLWDQISDANDSITSNMREGFEQSSDNAFANFLVYAKASTAEVVSRLHSAKAKGLITDEQLTECDAISDELSKMLGGFIKYLRRSGFKDRGSFQITNAGSTNRPAGQRPANHPKADSATRIKDRDGD